MSEEPTSKEPQKAAHRTLVVKVSSCARCLGDHDSVTFQPFTTPPEGFTHFGLCPENKEPILMVVVLD